MMWEWIAGFGFGGLAVFGVYAYVAHPKYSPCCVHALRKGRDACYELEGISAFGDVIDKCRYCETREVFVVRGKEVELLIFKADEWRLMRGKVPTEGFYTAKRLSERARARHRESGRRQGAAGERK